MANDKKAVRRIIDAVKASGLRACDVQDPLAQIRERRVRDARPDAPERHP